MKKEDAKIATGLSLPVVVFIVFLTLKLSGVIAWPWVWVLSPIWIEGCILWAFVIIALIEAFISTVRRNRRR